MSGYMTSHYCSFVCVQQDLPDSLHYLKIFTAGHEVPSDSTILSFKKAVRRFLHDNQNNGTFLIIIIFIIRFFFGRDLIIQTIHIFQHQHRTMLENTVGDFKQEI